jgi:hypothetical protein
VTDWGVFVRDRNRRLVASLDSWTDLQLVLRYRDVSSWQLTAPVSSNARALATAGNGVIVRRNGVTLLSGPVTSYTEQWGESDPGDGTLVITGRDDLIDLARNLAEPDPLVAGTPTQANDKITGAAETVIRSYVDRNIGTAARAGRTRHVMGQTANLAQGSVVTGNARYDNLLDLAVALATAGGIGFRAIQDAGGIAPLFDVYVPVDRSASVVFSKTGGSLSAYSYTLSAPTATRALVAGQGEGILRTLVEVTSSTLEEDWDAVARVFVDRRDTDNADGELTQEGAAAIIDGGATAGLSVTPIDLPGQTFGVHYGLGDIVSVDIDSSTRITDVLASVKITASADAVETISPVIGAGEAGETLALFAAFRRLGTRVGLLERRV